MKKLGLALFAALTLGSLSPAMAALLTFNFAYRVDFCDAASGACSAFGLAPNSLVTGTTSFDDSLIDASGIATITPGAPGSTFNLLFGSVPLNAADDIGGFGGPGVRVMGSTFAGLFLDATLTDFTTNPDTTYLLSFSPDFGAVPAFQLTASGTITDFVATGTLFAEDSTGFAVPEPESPTLLFTAMGLLLLLTRRR